MAKMSLESSPKYRRLVAIAKRDLGINKAELRGLLEQLWDVSHSIGPSFKDHIDVEVSAQWEGVEGRFTALLASEKWLDEKGDKTLEIHDYFDHAPHWVKERERKRLEKVGAKSPKVGEHSDPSQVKSSQAKSSQAKPSNKKEYSQQFEHFWLAYPRRADTSKVKAFESWQKSDLDGMADAICLAVETLKATIWQGREMKYIPHPTTFLNQRRWESVAERPKEKKNCPKCESRGNLGFQKDANGVHYEPPRPIKCDNCGGTGKI